MQKTDASIEIDPRKDGFGAVVRGLDLSSPLGDETVQIIREEWARRGVLVFPEQTLSPEELESFTLSLGDFGHDPFIE